MIDDDKMLIPASYRSEAAAGRLTIDELNRRHQALAALDLAALLAATNKNPRQPSKLRPEP